MLVFGPSFLSRPLSKRKKQSGEKGEGVLLPRLVGMIEKNGPPSREWFNVAAPAQAFALAALLVSRKTPAVIVAPDVRVQERLADELPTWLPGGVQFPQLTAAVVADALPDPEILAERLAALQRLDNRMLPWFLIHAEQLDDPVPPEGAGSNNELAVSLRVGAEQDPAALAAKFVALGYEKVPQVFGRGQFALRGGILDVFSWQQLLPARIEFFGDVIESIREFDPEGQRSLDAEAPMQSTEVVPPPETRAFVPLRERLAGMDCIFVDPAGEPGREAFVTSAPGEEAAGAPSFFECAEAQFAAGDFVLDEAKRAEFLAVLRKWIAGDWMVCIFCDNEGEQQRLVELLGENDIAPAGVRFLAGVQERSFVCPALKLAVLSDSDLFGRSISRRMRRLAHRREHLLRARAADDMASFAEGDFVVHIEHGIGRYLGLQRLPGETTDVLALEFANEARLYVPVEQAWMVSRYIGLGRKHPDLSELGSEKWEKAKQKTRDAVFLYARQMLRLQAERETSQGFACPPDTPWQKEFEDAFPFEETPDQARAIVAAKQDMENAQPMDRLVCGDVGFGKTEVAIRAAFKAVMSGKQAAFLAPTTVLAQQHFETLRERMSDFPVRIASLTRYRTTKEQNETLGALARGDVDILVGTHRLLSADVVWKDLGLLIVDEEQRFGVKQKDLIKERFRLVDVLTLSATPIPRTLYMALMGARDMSVIDTPPANRQPVETLICPYDERIIRDAASKELARGGQVYLLHNRVATIERLAAKVRELLPGARVDVGHGQMTRGELEDVMHRFVSGKTDVLVSTTIIESGLDIPNANTIIIDRADMFGLADLYQLRGRVGRAGRKAYAYLLLPRSLLAVGAARKRISAIKQYTELGSGFKIAMRDLEIRGAGNILGTAQSGHIVTVGFDLYCRMLRQAVNKLAGAPGGDSRRAALRLDFLCLSEGEFFHSGGEASGAFLPAEFIPDSAMRIDAYRKYHEAGDADAIESLRFEWKDRFGTLPVPAENLLLVGRIALTAGKKKITAVEVREDKLMLTRRGDFLLIDKKFPRIRQTGGEAKLREILEMIGSLA